MAFGQEMKDFLNAFQAGYSMFKSKEERENEREDRQMKRDLHNWKAEDRQYDRQERQRTWDWRERSYNWDVFRHGHDTERWLKEHQLRRDAFERRQEQLDEEGGVLPDDDFSPRTKDPTQEGWGGGVDGSAIDDTTTGSIQPASYTPNGGREQAARASVRRGSPQTGTEVARALVMDLHQDLGLPPEVAVGVVGQLAAESGGFTQLQELNPTVKGSRGGYGYAQWTGPRRKQFEQFSREKGLDPSSYEANYAFLKHELTNTPEGRILEELKTARDPFTAGRIFTGSAKEGRGFLRPGIVNASGRDRWTAQVADLFYEPVTREQEQPRRALTMARGGMVSALPDEEEDVTVLGEIGVEDEMPPYEVTPEGNAPTPSPRPSALPVEEEGAMPSPSYDGAKAGADIDPVTRRIYEAGREAVREGINRSVERQRAGAIDTPDDEAARRKWVRGEGAAPDVLMREIASRIDPDRSMPPSQRNMRALAEVYKFYEDRGELDKAKQSAEMMIHYYNRSFQQFSALSLAAAEKGDMDAAAKAAIAAYANIPNGRDLQVTNAGEGRWEVTVVDEETGETVNQRIMTPDMFGEIAMGFTPGLFYDEIIAAAGRSGPERKTASPTQLAEIEAGVQEVFESTPEIAGLGTGIVREATKMATDLAADEGNTLTGNSAAGLMFNLLQLPPVQVGEDKKPDMDAEDEPPFILSKVPGSRNLVDLVVPSTGETYRVSSNFANNLKKLRKSMFDKRKAELSKPSFADTANKFVGELQGRVRTSPEGAPLAPPENMRPQHRRMISPEEGAIPDDMPPGNPAIPPQYQRMMR